MIAGVFFRMEKLKKFTMPLSLIVAALALRLVQIFAITEKDTGFYKNSVWGVIITVLVGLMLAVVAIWARRCEINASGYNGGVITNTFVMGFAAVSLLYEVIFEWFAVQGFAWQVVLMKSVGVLTAAYFVAMLFKGFYKFDIPDLCHTLPAIYLIIRIICSFINISSLSLIAENIFLIASFCCALLFFVSYASLKCKVRVGKKALYTRAVLAFSVCFITAASNIIANALTLGNYTHIPTYSQAVLFGVALFIGNFIYNKFIK